MKYQIVKTVEGKNVSFGVWAVREVDNYRSYKWGYPTLEEAKQAIKDIKNKTEEVVYEE